MHKDLTDGYVIPENSRATFFSNAYGNIGAKIVDKQNNRVTLVCKVPAYRACYAEVPIGKLKTAEEVDPSTITGSTVD
ncbi:MAG: hypothetical protein KTR18_16580 [Acidiferrobacterales bacterium]|nr:hypothetical protein [Acidiferrobacterales bacterium]